MTPEDALAAIPSWDIPTRLQKLETLKQKHLDTGGTSTAYYTAVTDLLAIQRLEALEDGNTKEANHLGELLYEMHKGFAVSYVRKFIGYDQHAYNNPNNTNDYTAAAYLGLWEAIDKYTPGIGAFTSHAYNPIRRHVLQALRANEYANMNFHDFERRPKVVKAVRELEQEKGSDWTIEEVAARAGVTEGVAYRVLNPVNLSTDSQYDQVNDEEYTQIPPDLVAEEIETAYIEKEEAEAAIAQVQGLLTILTRKELDVIVKAYGLNGEPPKRVSEIAKEYGMSREWIREIRNTAMVKLRNQVATD